jgi:nephrocystin-3
MAAPWKTLRLFISSTFRDMHAERDHLVRFVFPRLREVLLSRRIHLIDVDLRWGVTSEQDSVAACREIIDECQPRFMGMLGGRYGWVPPEKDQSITEDEVRYGVLERDAEIRGNAFFYLRDEEVTVSVIEKQVGDFREPPGSENARKLEELKQYIANAGLPVFTYSARWDPIHERLTGLEAFGEHVYAYLLKNIKDDPELADRFAGSSAGPTDEFAEEREAMEAFIEDRTARYIVGSRQALLDTMTAFAADNNEHNILVVEGEPGSGKSSLLGKLCQLLAPQPHALLISHFVGASVGSTDLRRTLRRLCHELASAEESSDPLPEDIRELTDLLAKLLVKIAARRRVILVMDAINQFDGTNDVHGMGWLPLVLPPNVRVILSSLEHTALDALRKRTEQVRTKRLELLSEADTRLIIAAFLQRYSKRFSGVQIDALLAKPESRLPLYVLTALLELRTLGTYEEITTRIRQLPGEAKPLFVWILKNRLSNDPGFRDVEDQLCGSSLVTKFASCLGISRHGLSQEELVGLIDPGDRLGNVAALLRLLRPYLMHRGELIDFFHSQLREAVENEFLQTEEERQLGHRVLGLYFMAQVRAQLCPGRSHGGRELLYHLQSAAMWDQIVSALADSSVFGCLSPSSYGVSYDSGEFTTVDEGGLRPEALRDLPSKKRSKVAHSLAAIFAGQARQLLDRAMSFPQPWPLTAHRLRQTDSLAFAKYRDTFYSFMYLSEMGFNYSNISCDGSRKRSSQFLHDFADIVSFNDRFERRGHEEAGLSHQLEHLTNSFGRRKLVDLSGLGPHEIFEIAQARQWSKQTVQVIAVPPPESRSSGESQIDACKEDVDKDGIENACAWIADAKPILKKISELFAAMKWSESKPAQDASVVRR